MTVQQKFFSILLVFLCLGLFYFAGSHYLLPEYQFKFQKLFVPAAILFLIAELIRSRMSSSFERNCLAYLRRLHKSEQKEVEAVSDSSPLYPFYTNLLKVLELFSKPDAQLPDTDELSPVPFFEILTEPNRQPTQLAHAFLARLNRYFPNAELFLFAIGNQKIYLISQLNTASPAPKSSRPSQFSILSEFSGKAYNEGEPVITNDLKSDTNLGQFLSSDNPGTPIYGAVFPLGVQGQVQGLLWIRDESQALEYLNRHKDFFQVLSRLLCQELFALTPDLTLEHPLQAMAYPQFESHSRYFHSLASLQKLPFVLTIVYLKFKEEDSQTHHQAVQERILDHLPLPSIFTREDQLYHLSFYGLDRKTCLLHMAKMLDKIVRYLSIEQGETPIGEINLGISFLESDTEMSWKQSFKEAHTLLKNSIASGPNLLRVSDEVRAKDED